MTFQLSVDILKFCYDLQSLNTSAFLSLNLEFEALICPEDGKLKLSHQVPK